jgi:hypothetical protein
VNGHLAPSAPLDELWLSMQINEKVMINDELSVLDAVATDDGR